MKLLMIAFLIACACDIQAQAKSEPQISKPQSPNEAERAPDSVKVTLSAAEYDGMMKALTQAAATVTGAKKQSEYLSAPVVIWQVIEVINERRALIYLPGKKDGPPAAKKVP